MNAGSELKTHYSVGWHWFTGGNLTFNGASKNVLMHMIDIFDSIDVQTAYIRGHIMVDRLQKDLNGQQSVSSSCLNKYLKGVFTISMMWAKLMHFISCKWPLGFISEKSSP